MSSGNHPGSIQEITICCLWKLRLLAFSGGILSVDDRFRIAITGSGMELDVSWQCNRWIRLSGGWGVFKICLCAYRRFIEQRIQILAVPVPL